MLLTSPAIVAEVQSVLHYSHIQKKYLLTDDDIDQIVSLLEHDALLVPGDSDVSGSIPADIKDEMIKAKEGELLQYKISDGRILDSGSEAFIISRGFSWDLYIYQPEILS